MPYLVEFDTKAAKEVKALPKRDRARIIEKAQSLSTNPRPLGSVKLTGNLDLWRIRLGVYRIIYQIQEKKLLVTVVKVGHRRDVYRRF